MKRVAPFLLLLLVVLLFVGGGIMRDELALTVEWSSMEEFQGSLQSLRDAVERLGWGAPFAFLLIATFRYFLLLPSALVLTASGLIFGALEGTMLGTVGILLSSLVHYGVGRFAGRELLIEHFGDHFRRVESAVESAGPWIVGAGTAHPAGSMGLIQTAGGVVGMSIGSFLLAVILAAPIRAATFAFLGSTIVEMPWWQSLAIATAMFIIGALPLLHPSVREKVFGRAK